MKDKIKIMVMSMVALIATMISDSGFPGSGNEWIVFGVTVGGVIITYVAKNFLMPSSSDGNKINIMDIVSGLLLAIGTAITGFVANLATEDPMDWTALGKLIGVVVLGYFSKTFFQTPIKK